MSTALQFTSVFNPANPPQKLNNGGVGVQTKKFEDITQMANKKFNIDDMKNLKGTEPRFNIRDMQKRVPKKTTEDKMNMLADKALEARGVKTEAIKDLETPPPVSVADNDPILVPPPQLERLPFDPRFDDATPMNPMEYGIKQEVDPSNLERMRELGMILQAQNNMGGIMATPMMEETGLAALANMTYGDDGKITV